MTQERRDTPEHAEVLAMGDSPCWPLKHDGNCESVAVDIGVGEMHSPCGCEVRWYQRALRLFMPSETLFKDAAPQPSTAALTTAPSQEGVGHGDVAAAAPSDDKKDRAVAAAEKLAAQLEDLGHWPTWATAEETAALLRALLRRLAPQSAVARGEPDGFAVLLDDPGETPGNCGYWYVGAYRTEVVANDVAKRNKGARVIPMYFSPQSARAAFTGWVMWTSGDGVMQRVCRTEEDVRRFLQEAIFGEPVPDGCQEMREIDAHLANFKDADNWGQWQWALRFEDGGVHALRLDLDTATMNATDSGTTKIK